MKTTNTHPQPVERGGATISIAKKKGTTMILSLSNLAYKSLFILLLYFFSFSLKLLLGDRFVPF
jgi:hypothetical protein